MDLDTFIDAKLDLGREMSVECEDGTVEIVMISALEDISKPSINPDCSPIKKGDIVWCRFIRARAGIFDNYPEPDTEYKPLWESGLMPGFITVNLFEDEAKYINQPCLGDFEICLN